MDYHRNQDTYSVVKRVVPEGQDHLRPVLCLRRAAPFWRKVADQLGCTKVAWAHHRDDIVQTAMLNMFHGGSMEGHAAQSWSRRRQACGDPPHGLCAREGHDALGPVPELPPSSCVTSAAARTALQRVTVGEMLREWDKKFPAASRACSAPWAIS